MEKAPAKEPRFNICHAVWSCVALDCHTVSFAAEADGLMPPREVTFPIRPLIFQRGTVRRRYPSHCVPVWIEPADLPEGRLCKPPCVSRETERHGALYM